MNRTKIAQLFAAPESFEGQSMTVCGWARTIRDMKNFGFVELNDGSCFKSLQIVMDRNLLNNYDEIARQNVGAALICHGILIVTPDAPQPFELKADGIVVEGTSSPITPCRKSATVWNICAPSSICGPARICFPPPSASAAWQPMPCTNFSRAAALCM